MSCEFTLSSGISPSQFLWAPHWHCVCLCAVPIVPFNFLRCNYSDRFKSALTTTATDWEQNNIVSRSARLLIFKPLAHRMKLQEERQQKRCNFDALKARLQHSHSEPSARLMQRWIVVVVVSYIGWIWRESWSGHRQTRR